MALVKRVANEIGARNAEVEQVELLRAILDELRGLRVELLAETRSGA